MRPEEWGRRGPGSGWIGLTLLLLFLWLLLLPRGLRAENGEAAALCSQTALSPSLSTSRSGDAASVRTAQRMIDRATAAYSAGRYLEAIRELRVAYQITPVPDLLFNLAQSCRAAGQSEAALALYQSLLPQQLPPALHSLVEQRERELRQALAQAAAQQGAQLLIEKRYAQAQSAWERAYERVQEPVFLLRIAQAQRLDGRNTEAIASFERFLSVSKDPLLSRDATEQLAALRAERLHEEAQAHLRAQRPAEAATLWARAYSLNPDPQYLLAQAEAERLGGLSQEAIRSYERFLEKSPESPARAAVVTQLQALRARQSTPSVTPISGTAPTPREAPIRRKQDGRPIWKRPWLWISIAAAVVVTTTVVAVTTTQTADAPSYPNLRVFTFPGEQDAR